MTCEQVRELLPEHLLGSLEGSIDTPLRRHLRGCAECRAERMRLEDGVATLSHATHNQDPPEQLRRRVLDVLSEEWDEPAGLAASDGPSASRTTNRSRWVGVAAAVALLAVSLTWGASQSRRAAGLQADAASYQSLLDTLGGKEFRLGELRAANADAVTGSVVLYDGAPDHGWNSWVIVLASSPGYTGEARAHLTRAAGDSMELPALHFSNGEASSWLVTHEDLTAYDELLVTGPDGSVLATAGIVEA